MLQRLAVFLLSLVLLVVVAFGYLLWFANTDAGRRAISSYTTRSLDREVVYHGHMRLKGIFPPAVEISGLTVANLPDGRRPQMLELGEAQVAWSPLALLRGAVKFPYIFIRDGNLSLERPAEGPANWQFGEAQTRAEEEPASRSRIELGILLLDNTTLRYYDAPRRIDLALLASTENGNVAVTGKGTYLGQGFGLEAHGGQVLDAREDIAYPVDALLTVGGTTLHAVGTVQNPTALSGLDVRLRVKGDDASELFPLFGIALPPTPPYDISGQLHYDGDVWLFEDFKGVMGNSDIGGSLSWDRSRERPLFTARFVSQKLDFKDLGPLIGAERGTLADEDNPYVIPDVPLDISRLAAMDADVTFTGESVISPALPLDDFLLNVTLDNMLLHIDPVKFGTADGDITARLTVNARQEPVDIDADFRFARLSLARLMEGVQNALPNATEADGLIGGTAKLKGQGKSLKQMLSTANGDIGIGMQGGQLSQLLVELVGLDVAQSVGFLLAGDQPVPIRCIIGDFAVKDGVMHSRALVLDNADTNIQGEGTIDLQSEEMRLRIVPQPKDSSFASLRTPLRIEGTLKNPDFIPEKTALLARGAGVALLSTALTPIAGVLALLDPSSGEDSDCDALVADLRRHTDTGAATSEIPQNPTPPAAAEHETRPEPTPTTEKDPATAHQPPRAGGSPVTPAPGEVTPVYR